MKKIVACWFVLQIVLPFTAPLQTLDVHDLFGTKSTHGAQSSPESTTTPTVSEASAATAFVALLEPTTLCASAVSCVAQTAAHHDPLSLTFTLPPAPQVQRSVLRL